MTRKESIRIGAAAAALCIALGATLASVRGCDCLWSGAAMGFTGVMLPAAAIYALKKSPPNHLPSTIIRTISGLTTLKP